MEGWGCGGHVCKNDGQQLVEENITIDNKGQSELTNSSITVSRFPGGRAASQRIRVHESIWPQEIIKTKNEERNTC